MVLEHPQLSHNLQAHPRSEHSLRNHYSNLLFPKVKVKKNKKKAEVQQPDSFEFLAFLSQT